MARPGVSSPRSPKGRASWPCLHEFFAIATHARIYSPPSTPDQASLRIEAWLASPSLLLLAENERHWPQLRGLIDKARLQGPMVHDAHIVALCLSHGVRELWSADRDSSRIPGLRVRNPLG